MPFYHFLREEIDMDSLFLYYLSKKPLILHNFIPKVPLQTSRLIIIRNAIM